MSPIENDSASTAVLLLLRDRYGLQDLQLQRLPIGQGTINYRASGPHGAFFVKRYTAKTHLPAEEAGIALSEQARHAGIPAAAVIPNRDGQWLDRSSPIALSVWSWVEGDVRTEHLSRAQYGCAGSTLGAIHRIFAPLPESRAPALKSLDWRKFSLPSLQHTIDRILGMVRQRVADGVQDEFDAGVLATLPERTAQLQRLPTLMAELPELGSQVLHGDYTFVNLLFQEDRIAAVLDFRPPEAFLRAYDLGRIAFHPSTVALHPRWLDSAAVLVTEYCKANPGVPARDVEFCGRVALLQLLKSLYGVQQHYLEPALIQDDLDTFWHLRHVTVGRMLEHLAEIDAMLRSACAGIAVERLLSI